MRIAPNFTRPDQVRQAADFRYGDNEKPVAYDAQVDGPVQDFEKGEKGQAVRRQFTEGIVRLQDFAKATKLAQDFALSSHLPLFRRRIEQGAGGYYSTEISLLYSRGKSAFDLVCEKIADEHIPETARVNKLRELLGGLDVCAPGVVTNIIKASEDLSSPDTLRTHVKQLWHEMLDQSIRDFCIKNHSKVTHYSNHEIHFVNGYHNYLAHQYGFLERPDNVIPVNWITPNLDACAKKVSETVTPSALVEFLANQYLQDLGEHFPDYLGRPLTESEVGKFYTTYAQGFQITAAERYGNIDSAVAIEQHPDQSGAGEDETLYRIVTDPTMVAHAIAKNLRKCEILVDDKFPLLLESKEDTRIRKLKVVGDAPYLKELMQDGEVIRRALRVSDIDENFILDKNMSPAAANAALTCLMRWSEKQPSLREQNAASKAIIQFVDANDVLAWAADQGHNDLLQTTIKLETAAGPDGKGLTALMRAARKGHSGAIAALLKSKKNIEGRDKQGMTALHHAAAHGNTAVVKTLLQAGANRESLDKHGRTALHHALSNAHIGVFKTLADAGANIPKELDADARFLKELLHHKDAHQVEHALSLFRQAISFGDKEAMCRIGEMYENGRSGLAKNEIDALIWYCRAADMGDTIALYYLGRIHENGLCNIEKDDQKATSFYQKAANLGHAAAQYHMGVRYEHGRGGCAKDLEQAVVWYRKAADQGDASAKTALGYMCQHGLGGLVKDENRAVALFIEAAEQGDARGQYHLGKAYRKGIGGLPIDRERAARWNSKALEQGDSYAQNAIGFMYDRMQGHDREAVTWYSKSALQGNPVAQYNLGVMYRDYRGGLSGGMTAALTWFRKAADQGDRDALYVLGKYYYDRGEITKSQPLVRQAADNGHIEAHRFLGHYYEVSHRGVEPDVELAEAWYRKAALLGDLKAQLALAERYETGLHRFVQDYAQAAEWYRKAAEQGSPRAYYRLGLMHEKGLGGLANDPWKAYECYQNVLLNNDNDTSYSDAAIRRELAISVRLLWSLWQSDLRSNVFAKLQKFCGLYSSSAS